MDQVKPFAEEVWVLPDLMPAEAMPAFIFDFIVSRGIEVIHLMNSRIGFDLLPDLASLPHPPSVVVQLHVEEVDKSGYVRYVTTRYGNLVDRFSISNEHVASAVRGYGIPAGKVEVIYTGVDADEEFSPTAHAPAEELDDARLQVLFGARITDQKDPLLMAEVAAGLRDRGVDFQIHVVGEGDLEGALRSRLAELELGDSVVIHPPTPGLQGWYAACDVLLMTSKFEGIPCALFEAMAMGTPIIAPALPGISELLSEDEDGLIEDRAAAAPYVDALAGLAADPKRREAVGAELRARAKRRFSVRQMAALHEDLYRQLAAARPRPASAPAPLPEPLRFINRAVLETPLVSVLIPHYNQSLVLGECVESVRAQDYPQVEIVVVDDASTEVESVDLLAELERDEDTTVVRLTENGGPSRARNAGLEHCRGRFVLPVDADNLLIPDAIEKLVAQLNSAAEDVGFIYPNLDFFGNRDEYHKAPPYNLFSLLHANFCDTCSLIDREVFDAGLRYHEGIHLGHEDWEFALALAERGVRGEPAGVPTIRYRKWGFNRSDMVDHSSADFRESFLAEVSHFEGHEARIKAIESPALSLLALAPLEPGTEKTAEILGSLARQSCIDLELVVDADERDFDQAAAPPVRRFPAGTPIETLERGLGCARGSYVALTADGGGALLADPTFAEKALRRFDLSADLAAIVLWDAGANVDFQVAVPAGEGGADPHAVIWRRRFERDLPYGLVADPAAPVESIVRLLSGAGLEVEWRHLPSPDRVPAAATDTANWTGMPADPAQATDPHGLNPPEQLLLPGRGGYEVQRWEATPSWIPPLSAVAIRYREHFSDYRPVLPGEPPATLYREHFLGVLRSTGVQGTRKLVAVGDTYRALERDEWRKVGEDAIEIGYLEEAPLPGFDAIALAVHRASGNHVLVSLPEDPILAEVDVIEHLGFADPFPLRPREVPEGKLALGLVGLVKSVDLETRRHRYGVGGFPRGERIGELGGLAESGLQGEMPLWIIDDYVVTAAYSPPLGKPAARRALGWAAEPVRWRGFATPADRAKVMVRRAIQGGQSRARLGRLLPGPDRDPDGWLFSSPRPGMQPLYASHHPVTADQLLTRSAEDAAQMGYENLQLLGFMRPEAPLTGSLDQQPVGMPWARHAGHVPLSS
jgi:glycosyltransferase involved in cell wall biosynthesis